MANWPISRNQSTQDLTWEPSPKFMRYGQTKINRVYLLKGNRLKKDTVDY